MISRVWETGLGDRAIVSHDALTQIDINCTHALDVVGGGEFTLGAPVEIIVSPTNTLEFSGTRVHFSDGVQLLGTSWVDGELYIRNGHIRHSVVDMTAATGQNASVLLGEIYAFGTNPGGAVTVTLLHEGASKGCVLEFMRPLSASWGSDNGYYLSDETAGTVLIIGTGTAHYKHARLYYDGTAWRVLSAITSAV